jgi:hypothetical protein
MPSSESDLVIVSVVRYADSCDPIRRHNDCPFAVEHEGTLTCHQECRGVIKSLLRRGRSEPASRSESFDAGQLRLSEPDGSPDALWYTSSLLQEVSKAVHTFPFRRDGSLVLKRLVYATSALGALGGRGVDPEQLVRRGLAEPVKLALAASLAKTPSDWEHMAEWRAIFEEPVTREGDFPETYFRAVFGGPIARYLDAWIATAPIKDVLLWKPPASGEESPAPESAQEDIEVWTWIVERFTQTYLDKWSLSSLKREYAFVQGSWQPEFSTEVLAERVVTREKVAIALADRAMESSEAISPAMMNAFTDQALNLLRGRQRAAAVGLFKAARMLKPNDVTAMNNYAFCIVIDNPGEAKSLLVETLERGARNPAVTWCNLALAESFLGEVDAALNACEEAYQAKAQFSAPLWVQRDEDWVVERVKPQVYSVRLAAELEQSGKASGDVWASRLKVLNLDSQLTSSDPSSAEIDVEDL